MREEQTVVSLPLESEDRLPVVFHADDGPAVLLCLDHERVAERADLRLGSVGKLTRGVVVMHEHHQPHAAPGLCPLQHLLIAGRISKRGDGPSADVLIDADRFPGLVIYEIHFRQAYENRLAVARFILRLDAAADDLLGWDAVDLFRPRTHELDAAAGHDEGLKAV